MLLSYGLSRKFSVTLGSPKAMLLQRVSLPSGPENRNNTPRGSITYKGHYYSIASNINKFFRKPRQYSISTNATNIIDSNICMNRAIELTGLQLSAREASNLARDAQSGLSAEKDSRKYIYILTS